VTLLALEAEHPKELLTVTFNVSVPLAGAL